MNAAPQLPEWPPPTGSQIDAHIDAETSRPWRISNPFALFVAAAVVGLAAGLGIGIAVGYVVGASAQNDCSPSDGWCSFGAALTGLFAGAVVGVISYVAAGVTTVVRCRPSGRRAGHVVAHLVFPFAAVALLTILQALIELSR